jgi:hypothetical protein
VSACSWRSRKNAVRADARVGGGSAGCAPAVPRHEHHFLRQPSVWQAQGLARAPASLQGRARWPHPVLVGAPQRARRQPPRAEDHEDSRKRRCRESWCFCAGVWAKTRSSRSRGQEIGKGRRSQRTSVPSSTRSHGLHGQRSCLLVNRVGYSESTMIAIHQYKLTCGQRCDPIGEIIGAQSSDFVTARNATMVWMYAWIDPRVRKVVDRIHATKFTTRIGTFQGSSRKVLRALLEFSRNSLLAPATYSR